MRWADDARTGACCLCSGNVSGGYIDVGFADMVCASCAKEIHRIMAEREGPPRSEQVCKQCGAVFENKGQLLAHYRREHQA